MGNLRWGFASGAIIGLFADLVEENTPDLYRAEWQLIANSLDLINGYQRLPMIINVAVDPVA
jgi:hypothetical protein